MDHVSKPSKIPLPEPGALLALNRLCARFIWASLICLGIGIVFGLLLMLEVSDISVFAHVHLTLIGFVIFLIYGVGYKLVPTMFAAKHTIRSQKMADTHFWLSIIGIVLMIGAELLSSPLGAAAEPALIIGGVLQVVGAFLFIYQMGMMLK